MRASRGIAAAAVIVTAFVWLEAGVAANPAESQRLLRAKDFIADEQWAATVDIDWELIYCRTGERVVVSGASLLRDGEAVRVLP